MASIEVMVSSSQKVLQSDTMHVDRKIRDMKCSMQVSTNYYETTQRYQQTTALMPRLQSARNKDWYLIKYTQQADGK